MKKYLNLIKKEKQKIKGFSLIEVIVYMAILILILFIILGSLVMVTDIQEKVIAGKDLNKSATVSIDRILRETRSSTSIDIDNSVFDDQNGVLSLEHEDTEDEIIFYLSDSSLYLEKEGETQRLTHKGTDVLYFNIDKIESDVFDAVKVRIGFSHPYSDGSIEQSFRSTAILRGSYEDQ